MKNPVHFLRKSGKGFFESREGYPLCLGKGLSGLTKNPEFVRQFRDVVTYRAMDYYSRRYQAEREGIVVPPSAGYDI